MALPTEKELDAVFARLPSWSQRWPAGSVRIVFCDLLEALEAEGWQLVRRPGVLAEARPASSSVSSIGPVLALGRRR